jgi:hypothetical protein
MAKVKVVGDINFEFDVKFNQNEDIVIEAKAIDIGGEKVYIGTGDIEKIDPKAFSFIASRIEYFLKKNGAYILSICAGGEKDKFAEKVLIQHGLGFLLDAMVSSKRAIEEMLSKKMFLLTESGMRIYLNDYYDRKYKGHPRTLLG